jgi:predicted tellurium resistance membrane protein TerC
MEWLMDPQAWISILVSRLPAHQQQSARIGGLALAMMTRIALLLSLAWLMKLTQPLFTVPILEHTITGRDMVLLLGGLFLLWKSTQEIYTSLEGPADETSREVKYAGFVMTLVQIAIIDIVFSLDSVITAVGMADHVPVMVLAIVIAVIIMMFAAKPIGDFVDNHPSVKMLALSFLILVGFALMGESLGLHIPKGYIYTAMAFSLGVEMLNIRQRKISQKKAEPVALHRTLD